MTSAPPSPATSGVLQYLQNAIRESPWIHLAVLPPAIVAVLSFAASATPAEQAAAWSIAVVAGTVGAGLLKRPVHVAVSAAAVTTIAGDLAALGLHLPPSAASAALAVVSVLSPVTGALGSKAATPGDVAAAVAAGPSPLAQITVTPTQDPPSRQTQPVSRVSAKAPVFPAGF